MKKRHRWIHVPHVYRICVLCGCGEVNAQTRSGHWYATFHTADGRTMTSDHTPPCELGPRTVPALRKYQSAIALTDELRETERATVLQGLLFTR